MAKSAYSRLLLQEADEFCAMLTVAVRRLQDSNVEP